MIYQQKKQLSASLCGADTKLSCIGAFSLIEDAATELMGMLGIDGVTTLKKYHAVWLFTRNHVRFLKPVFWREMITVECAISKKTRVCIYIDTSIRNAEGECCVASRLELCGIDKDSYRICRVDTIGADDRVEVEPTGCEINFFSKEEVSTSPVAQVVVQASNIDYVRHTNNVEYIRFLINSFSVEQLLGRPITELEVCYLNQSFEGDRLDIRRCEFSDRTVFEIFKGDIKIVKSDMRFSEGSVPQGLTLSL